MQPRKPGLCKPAPLDVTTSALFARFYHYAAKDLPHFVTAALWTRRVGGIMFFYTLQSAKLLSTIQAAVLISNHNSTSILHLW